MHKLTKSVTLPAENQATSHLRMMNEGLEEDRKEDRASVTEDFRSADQAEEADQETTEETEETVEVTVATMSTLAEAAVVGADEELEVQVTQVVQGIQEDQVAQEIPTEATGEALEVRCRIG